MANRQAIERREVAGALVANLASRPGLDAALLFGSSARGDAQQSSDLDLLLILSDSTELARMHTGLKARRRNGELRFVSIAAHTWDSLAVLRAEDWSFSHHLASEGLPLMDTHGSLLSRLTPSRPSDAAIRREMISRCRDLERYDDLTRFTGDFFLPLLNIYIVSKQLIILANIHAGISEFRRQRAFDVAQDLFPQNAEAVAHLQSLSPVYDLSTARTPTMLPPSLTDKSLVAASLQAIREFVAGVA
jgi:predicted nucleotidyltransferase